MKRQATLQVFGFTRKVAHRDTEVDVRVPRFVDAGKIQCLKCDRTFVNKQGLPLHMKCIPIYSAPEVAVPASNCVDSERSSSRLHVERPSSYSTHEPTSTTTVIESPSSTAVAETSSTTAVVETSSSTSSVIVVEDDKPKIKQRVKHDA